MSLAHAFDGLKVVDFTQIAAGPTCTLALADLGADVVKVEAPGGELGRAFFPFVEGESASFMVLNRNKRSIVLDLKQPGDLQVAQALAARADVLVESFRPGVMQRLGLGYEALAAANPRLVYCSISAYGQQGAWRDKPGVDGVVQATSGLMSVTGEADAGPCKSQVPVVDVVTGHMATVAVLAALAQRDHTGRGQQLDISMFGSAIALQQMALAAYLADGKVPARTGSAAPYAAPNEALRCADGWIMVAAYQPERWRALCTALALEPLLDDPRFADSAARVAHRAELVQALEARLRQGRKDAWLRCLEAADIICGPIHDYAEVVACDQFVQADAAETVHHPRAGRVRLPRSALASAGERATTRRPAPLLGQHTREVLAELGMADTGLPSPPGGVSRRTGALQD